MVVLCLGFHFLLYVSVDKLHVGFESILYLHFKWDFLNGRTVSFVKVCVHEYERERALLYDINAMWKSMYT